MKTKSEISDAIALSIEECTLGRVSQESVATNHSLIDDLGLDSLDYATVLVSTESKLNLKIEEDDLDWSQIRTVDQLSDLFFQAQ